MRQGADVVSVRYCSCTKVSSGPSLDNVVQVSSVVSKEALSHPKVTFDGTTTYDASFLGAQSVGRQEQAQPASSAHALPDAPFESSTEYSQVRPGCCGASASMSGKDVCVLPQVRTLCAAANVTCTRMQARDMRHTNTHDLQRYRGTPTPAEGAAFAPCKGGSHPIVPLESTTTYGVDYGPHRKGAHSAQARARLQKTLPTGESPDARGCQGCWRHLQRQRCEQAAAVSARRQPTQVRSRVHVALPRDDTANAQAITGHARWSLAGSQLWIRRCALLFGGAHEIRNSTARPQVGHRDDNSDVVYVRQLQARPSAARRHLERARAHPSCGSAPLGREHHVRNQLCRSRSWTR